jgi:phosphoglycerate dehydrogenase-like enzyme
MKDEDLAILRGIDPRIEVVADSTLTPPMRWDADFSGDPAFTRTPEQQTRFDAMVDSADILYGIPDVDPAALARTIRANPKLRWVHIMAAGGGAQVKDAQLTQEELDRVVFTTSAGVHAGPLAEFAVFGIFAGAKRLARLTQLKAAHEWSGRFPMGQVSEQHVLVVGLGNIGRQVAAKLSGLGARVTGLDKYVTEAPGVDRVITPEQITEVAPEIDAVAVTLPGTDATYHLVSADFFAAIKPGASLSSVGRGTVIDEKALIGALQDGRVGFATMDVFEDEPLPADSPLWDMDNVIVSPHTAANSPAEERLIAELFASNALKFLARAHMANVVNTIEFY